MAVLARFKSFGSNRFSGLGQVDRSLRTADGPDSTGREFAAAGLGRSGAQDRSTS
jgi:preprotein translocase subunit SecD